MEAVNTGEGRVVVIAGLNASGKTQLAERLRRELKSDSVRYVAFCDTYGTATDRSYYLQQRWNQHDIDAETPSVADTLERALRMSGPDVPARRRLLEGLCQLMGIKGLENRYVISLSSGELRKLQLVKTLLAAPQTLILDSPFIGLDASARCMLSEQLLRLKEQGMLLYLLLARADEIPDYADEIKVVGDSEAFNASLSAEALAADDPEPVAPPADGLESVASPVDGLGPVASPADSPVVIALRDVTIRYADRVILDRLNWTVRQGERWAMSGPNGSGKSTLLSLICADNPQAYACDITLFGRRRGTGETIWDIKRRIGYVSPELHRSYLRNLPALSIVASGLRDTVGLYVRYDEQEREQCLRWMRTFGIDGLAERSFLQLSSGEQRLVLLARAFVKDPELLILDEPMHGLDLRHRQQVKNIISVFCRNRQKTLVMVTHYEEELPPCMTHHLSL